ncbi:MAG: TetR/AcrR family transcriptional regulator [Candidatus Hydrogenedentales bacterium]|jgi:AcrR family transcriptional regulator
MGRNPEQNQQMKDARKERIFSAAVRLFAAKGLSATKIADIATASGMSSGLLYHYFNSKEEIFTELIRTAFDKMNAACKGLASMDAPPHKKISMAIDALLKSLDESEDFARTCVLIAQATISDAIPEEAKAVIESEYRRPYQVIARIMAAGQRAGTIRKGNPKVQALVFWTSFNGLAIYKAVHADTFKKPDPRMLERMFLETRVAGKSKH